jgi:arginyl-tRNA synthetase
MKIYDDLLTQITKHLNNYSINEVVEMRISKVPNYDYQINILVKHRLHKNIQEILKGISKLLEKSNLIENFEIANNYFINLRVKAEEILPKLKDVEKTIQAAHKENIIIDYGGPNIGKPLHVGHLRPLNIGRSIYNTNKIVGNKIYSDIHLGDWGMPVAQIITYCKLENINIEDLSVEMLEQIYPKASKKYRRDEEFKHEAQATNKLLTSGDIQALKSWETISKLTLSALRKTLSILNHNFDYWWGESSVNDLIPSMLESLESDKKIEKDNGAFISAQLTDPRILVTKSDGSYLYITTDLATALLRNQEIRHEKVLYVTDNRQRLHFEQLFNSFQFFEFPQKQYEHIGFGTINDRNGNPLKTRDGGNLKLQDLYQQAYNYIQNINSNISEADIHGLTNTVLTYSDLITNRKTDYKFDLEKFTNVSGKTGVYVQYAQVRANKLIQSISLSNKTLDNSLTNLNLLDRNLIIAMVNIEFYLELSIKNSEPHHLANYLYDLSYAFNAFYQDSSIKNMKDGNEKNQKVEITHLFIQYSHLVMSCLGIKPVQKM